ncbi:hypothetical protein [uncultured Rhodoblastus sp.]|uniref:hypothetical protein n=1 Tax=uncultured Rhodoblastus sp. TaxID=543037 RepID=UPI0025F2DC33|nr:hypothetical protein [uncultured Rhodoblastus sp.]
MSLPFDLETKQSPANPRVIALGYYLLVGAILLAFFVTFYPEVYAHFVPAEDEPGFFGGSLKIDPYHWLSSGYSKYFAVYPEWFAPYTNFIRPATSALAWVLYQIFGDRFGYYIIPYYIFILLAAVVLFRCLKDVGVSGPILLFAAILWPLSPPVISMGLWNFPFIFDVATALIVIVAFRAVLYEQYALAFLALALALATKETAAFAPVAAAATILIFRRFSPTSWGLATLMLLPAAIWAGGRQYYLGQFSGGTYARIGSESVAHAIGYWPVGLSPAFVTLKNLALHPGMLGDVKFILDLAAAGVNALVWVAIVVIYAKYLPRLLQSFVFDRKSEPAPVDKWLLAMLIWLGGSLAYLLVNNLYGRYGGCFALFLIMTLIAAAYLDRQSLAGRLSFASLIALTLLYVTSGIYQVNALRVQASIAQKLHASLDKALTGIGGPRHKVYVVNAARGFSSPDYLARLLNSPHELIYVNQFDACTKSAGFSGVPVNTPQGLHVTLPECAQLVFNAVTNPEFASGTVDVVQREGVGTYSFGSQKTQKFSIVPGYTLDGHEFYFQGVPDSADVIYYNWSNEKFERLGADQ